MYDNLDLTLHKEACPDTDFIKLIPQYLTNITTHGINQFGKYITGYLDNLKVSIAENRVKIYDSSICKYYLGDNFKTLTRGDTERAIEKISDSLHLPICRAHVKRIDFAQNFIMQFDEKVYYPYLGEARYYKRLEQNNGLYYNNQIRQLLFYGKEYEQRVKRQDIPELYRGRNVLRYELRFKKNLKEQLKYTEITASLLYDEVFYRKLLKRWGNEYFAIQKINSKLINMKPTGSKKEFIENLALFQVLEIGQAKLLSYVKEWQEKGFINKKQAYDIRATIKRISKTPIDKKGNDLINELNRKVKEATQNW